MKVVGAVLIVYSCVVGFALSFSGYYDSLLVNNPQTFWTLERYTSFIPTTVTKLVGHPDLVRVYYAGGGGTFQPTLRETGVFRIPLHVDVVAPDSSWQMKLVLEAGLPSSTRRSRHRAQRDCDSSRDRRGTSVGGPRAARGRGGPHPDHGGRSGAGADQGFELRPEAVRVFR